MKASRSTRKDSTLGKFDSAIFSICATLKHMLRLSGTIVRDQILESEKHRLLSKTKKRPPKLVVFLVGEDEASKVYVRQKERAAQAIGIESEVIRFSTDITPSDFEAAVKRADADTSIDGILIQRPVPLPISNETLNQMVSPIKDVDGVHPENIGRLLSGLPCHIACTPAGILALLTHYKFTFEGQHAVIVGRSLTVGLPVAQLLLQKNMTITQCHRHTTDLTQHTRSADLVVVAAGQAEMLDASAFKKGAWLVDVGIHRTADKTLVGDVRAEGLETVLAAASPVPGGVGPMTIAQLMHNTVNAFLDRSTVRE